MEYHKPGSFEEATELANKNAGIIRFLAGGTDVLVQLRSDIITPDVLIDMKYINGVKDIIETDDEWQLIFLKAKKLKKASVGWLCLALG